MFGCEETKKTVSSQQKPQKQAIKASATAKNPADKAATLSKKPKILSKYETTGRAPVSDNVSLSRSTAANRARAALAAQLVKAGLMEENSPLPVRIQVSFEQKGNEIIAKAVFRPEKR
ncbi:MAG: hypothetical protein VYC39_14965 [Myxococcota bacterium]|nr:hypothetical protein [Myxococcota bacterium]